MKQPIRAIKLSALIVFGFFCHSTLAVNAVNPNGVNVRSNGSTTVFLTFQGTAGQTSSDAFWCGEITVPANTVTTTNPCVSGTVFGHLPRNLNQARPSGGATQQNVPIGNTDLFGGAGPVITAPSSQPNLTDVMTIPASVARRAMQDARQGNNSSFFYVRQFESAGQIQFIAVTCRMAGGGARVPFALTEVRPAFNTGEGKVPVHLLALNENLPDIEVDIHFNGSGRLKGRWELVMPGDTAPEAFDLLPEASLPIEQRGLQKRFTVIERFDVFLPPSSKTTLKGPEKINKKFSLIGPYQLLLRVEATKDKEGDSNTGAGAVSSGGVAGFSVPPLRFYVATAEDVSAARRDAGTEKNISLISPARKPIVAEAASGIRFSWSTIEASDLYQIEFQLDNGTTYEALSTRWQTLYEPPPWWIDSLTEAGQGRWRVTAFGKRGKRTARSDWRSVSIAQ